MDAWRDFFRALGIRRRKPKKAFDVVTRNDGKYMTPETWLKLAAAMERTADELRKEFPREAVRVRSKFVLHLARLEKIIARHAWA